MRAYASTKATNKQVDAFDTIAGQNHKGEWMKATWTVDAVEGAQQSAAQ